MVGNKRLDWWLTSNSTVSPEGSSRLLSKALAALMFIASTGSISTTLRPPICAVCTTKLTRSRTVDLDRLVRFLGFQQVVVRVAAGLEQQAGLAHAAGFRLTGRWHSRLAIRRSASARLPIPAGPCNK